MLGGHSDRDVVESLTGRSQVITRTASNRGQHDRTRPDNRSSVGLAFNRSRRRHGQTQRDRQTYTQRRATGRLGYQFTHCLSAPASKPRMRKEWFGLLICGITFGRSSVIRCYGDVSLLCSRRRPYLFLYQCVD